MNLTTPCFDDLSEAEQENVSNNGSGKEYANYIRVMNNDGETVFLKNDAMEPEDARFHRDLKWVAPALRHAYAMGVRDGAASPPDAR
jgi:hypothetical protein